nr:lysosomal Pro-X carboxypeptidase-like [Ipomoea trifida]
MKLFTSAIQWQWLLSLLLLFLSLTTCDALSPPHKIPRLTPLYESILQRSSSKTQLLPPDFRTFYCTQTLDHFSYAPQSYATFQQRYIVNFKAIGFLTDNAPSFKALLVYIEHRHYEESIPIGDIEEALRNDTIRGYFNPAQALADYAQVLLYIKNNFSAHDSPIIVVGGSYGGNKDLNLVSELKDYLDGMYCAAAQYDSPAQQPVRVVCGGIDGAPKGADILDRIHASVVAIKGNKPCYTVSAIEGNQSFYPVSARGDDGWSWQVSWLINQRNKEIKLIQGWIIKYYADLQALKNKAVSIKVEALIWTVVIFLKLGMCL